MNLPHPTTDRNPHRVPTRRTQQCDRPAWRGRKRTPYQQATLIAKSIQQAKAHGEHRTPEQYTPNAETQTLVRQLLSTDAQ